MFGKPKDSPTDSDRVTPPVQPSQRAAAAPSRTPESADDVSSISPGITIVGKIAGRGTVKIFGRIEGELHASTVLINDGAQVEGDIVADELTVGGRVKGTIHANRVKLNGSAVVEGDIFHRSLSIEENARFEGSSRREESVVDAPRVSVSRSPDQPDPQSTVAAMEVNRKHNGAPENEWHAPALLGSGVSPST